MFLVQPLHGLTFAAQHLAAMAVLVRVVPGRLAATGQSAYAFLGTGRRRGGADARVGPLYARLGAGGYWAMALLCAAAVPAALGLRAPEGGGRPRCRPLRRPAAVGRSDRFPRRDRHRVAPGAAQDVEPEPPGRCARR